MSCGLVYYQGRYYLQKTVSLGLYYKIIIIIIIMTENSFWQMFFTYIKQ